MPAQLLYGKVIYIGLKMRDDRVRQIETADEIAKSRKQVLFIFRSDNAIAIYIFGKRVYSSKVWKS